MKVFVAEDVKRGYNSPIDYHWCDAGDLLMFGQFQLGNNNPSEISMCGIKSRKFTTHIVVKDIRLTKEFYKELLTSSIQKAFHCTIDEEGNFDVGIAWGFHFNVNKIMDELIKKAAMFNNLDKVKCKGRKLELL